MSENPTGQNTAGEGYDAENDPDADPEMMNSQHPDHRDQNDRDPAEGASTDDG